ncbi:MAG TPA: hypothetical protein DCS15_04415 [Flavobacteriales bacterium]|jgi:hypothetical protein|nr:hypothetical protein [Flavobacteriales bacterium]
MITPTSLSRTEQVIQIVHRLFIHTDNYNWSALQSEVLLPELHFDMTSVGGAAGMRYASDICDEWAEGFADLDSVNHLAGNIVVDFDKIGATVFCYATTTHYKANAKNGQTREQFGTYDMHLTEADGIWRIDTLRYTRKFISGNLELT